MHLREFQKQMLYFVTDLGDVAFLLPVASLILVYFLYMRALRTAILWTVMLGACLALTALFKIAFLACGTKLPSLNVHSPSGHTSLSTTIYLGTAILVAGGRVAWFRYMVFFFAAFLVFAIALSRTILDMHSNGEVLLGLFIGGACVAWFAERYYVQPKPGLPWQLAFGLLLAPALVVHGHHLSRESFFRAAAVFLRTSLAVCS